MTSQDSFEQRGKALEDLFYAKVDQELLAKMRESSAVDSDVAKLSELTGLSCKSTLAQLKQHGVTSESAAALRLVPLVEVAWGDGRIEESERSQVLLAASKNGISEDSEAGALLANWLQHKPSADLMDSWCEYAKALIAKLDSDSAANLRNAVVDEMQRVATSAGGLLGWGAVSKGESEIMQRVVSSLSGN